MHADETATAAEVPCGGEGCSESYCSVDCRLQASAEGHSQLCQNPAYRELVTDLSLDVAKETKGNASVALSMLVAIEMVVRGMALGVHPLHQEGVAELAGAVTYEPASTFDNTGALTIRLSEAIGAHLYLEDVLTLFALVQTNEFSSAAGSAVFRALSMVNHSCVPNALVDYEATGHAVLKACADIAAGEQVLIDYTAGVAPRLPYARRKELLSQRHFECFCAKCVRRQ
jgi:SET and MYND domain-containing protein